MGERSVDPDAPAGAPIAGDRCWRIAALAAALAAVGSISMVGTWFIPEPSRYATVGADIAELNGWEVSPLAALALLAATPWAALVALRMRSGDRVPPPVLCGPPIALAGAIATLGAASGAAGVDPQVHGDAEAPALAALAASLGTAMVGLAVVFADRRTAGLDIPESVKDRIALALADLHELIGRGARSVASAAHVPARPEPADTPVLPAIGGALGALLIAAAYSPWFGPGPEGAGGLQWLDGFRSAPGAYGAALVTAGAAIAAWLSARAGMRTPFPAGGVIAIGGLTTIVLIVQRIATPPTVYPEPRLGIYLTAALALAATALGTAMVRESGSRSRAVVRIDAAGLAAAVGVAALLASMTAGWYVAGPTAEPDAVGIEGQRLVPPETLSPWVASDGSPTPYWLALSAAVALLAALVPAFGRRRGRLGAALIVIAGLVAMLVVGEQIQDPDFFVRFGTPYPDFTPWIYVSLGSAALIAAAGAAAWVGATRSAAPAPSSAGGPTWPPGATVALTVGALGSILAALLISYIGAAIAALLLLGLRVPRFRLLVGLWGLVAIAMALTYEPCPEYGGDCLSGLVLFYWLLAGALGSTTLIAGIIAGRSFRAARVARSLPPPAA